MFQSLGTDYQAFGTVAESEENWTQRAKTEWETSRQSKIFLNKTAISFGFSQSALREKKKYNRESFFLEGRGESNFECKILQAFQKLPVVCNLSLGWVMWRNTQLKVLIFHLRIKWGWQFWGNSIGGICFFLFIYKRRMFDWRSLG